MAQLLHIHPVQPQPRLINQAVATLLNGGIIAYPTDSAYALGCRIGDKNALDRIRLMRQLDKQHNFTLICRDLSEIANYAFVNNSTYRLLKAYTPGPYTFILPATKEVPRRLQHPKRKTIGIRVPDNVIAQALLSELHEPLMSVTLILPPEQLPLSDPEDEAAYAMLDNQVDIIISAGPCGFELTTVIECVNDVPRIIRQGKGVVENL